MNLVEYVWDSPTNRYDPMGLQYPMPFPGAYPEPEFPRGAQDNWKHFTSFGNFCICPGSKDDRLRPITGVGPEPPSPARGPDGGQNRHFSYPTPNPVGAGGCEVCVALVIKCPPTSNSGGGVAVYHFTIGDHPCWSLEAKSWLGCSAIVCGGNDEFLSRCLANEVIRCAEAARISIDGVSGQSACGVWNGKWYVAN